ncbi:MAG: exodeoxyribonuclease VII large subunit [Candidatus Pacebacteria bacterium]|nr:exodeoxyribonuclease VII large subunit [Candidatus Paceibacterota bacterium]
MLNIIWNNKTDFTQTFEDKIFSVTECISILKRSLLSLGLLKIQGEISDINSREKYIFFKLKDKKTENCLNCFIGYTNVNYLKDKAIEGTEVVIYGYPNIYKKGNLTIEISDIKLLGEGAIKQAFEKLKLKLFQKGYFSEDLKKKLPFNIKTIGLITSESGAALKDFKNNLKEQGYQIYLKHVLVEGDYAEKSIINAIEFFNKFHIKMDTIILMRGGGSLESLNTFNSEKIAESIIASKIPIITGIGHEKDESIADLVGDLKCSTPTACANFLNLKKQRIEDFINKKETELTYLFNNSFNDLKIILNKKENEIISLFDLKLKNLKNILSNNFTKLNSSLNKVFYYFKEINQKFNYLLNTYMENIKNLKNSLNFNQKFLFSHFTSFINTTKTSLNNKENSLKLLNPQHILNKGYSLTYFKGKILKDISQIKKDDLLDIQLKQGEVKTKVQDINIK